MKPKQEEPLTLLEARREFEKVDRAFDDYLKKTAHLKQPAVLVADFGDHGYARSQDTDTPWVPMFGTHRGWAFNQEVQKAFPKKYSWGNAKITEPALDFKALPQPEYIKAISAIEPFCALNRWLKDIGVALDSNG